MRLDVCYEPALDPAAWRVRHERGEVPDALPYGLDKLARDDVRVTARQPVRRSGWERRLGFDVRQAAPRVRADITLCWHERTGVPAALTSLRPVMTGAVWATDEPRRLALLGLRRAAAVWVLSSGQLEPLSEAGVGAELVLMGIDETFFHPSPHPGGRQVLAAGNDRHRDFTTLVKALGRSGGRADITVYTRLPVDTEGTQVRVSPPVPHAELRTAYQEAAVVVVPTGRNLHASGLTCALEAMASGRPVVVSDTPGMSDYVDHGVTGLRVPVGDAAALRDAVQGLLADPDAAAAMGRAARDRVVRDLTTTHQAERLLTLARRALS